MGLVSQRDDAEDRYSEAVHDLGRDPEEAERKIEWLRSQFKREIRSERGRIGALHKRLQADREALLEEVDEVVDQEVRKVLGAVLDAREKLLEARPTKGFLGRSDRGGWDSHTDRRDHRGA